VTLAPTLPGLDCVGRAGVSATQKRTLVSQWHYVFVALTERGNALKSAFRLREDSDRAVAIYRVSVIRKVPSAALASRSLGDMRIHWRLHRRNPVRAVKRN
jgi:hypothetical protein